MCWRGGRGEREKSIKEGVNAWMSQTLYKIKLLCDYIQSVGMKTTFTEFLDDCVRLAFAADGELKKTNDESETVMQKVNSYLSRAYVAYHEGISRPLPYEQYEKFVSVCHSCGFYVHDKRMQTLYKETAKEHMRRGGRQPIQPIQPIQTIHGGSAETRRNRMRELLDELMKLLDESDEG
jgi:hypothetical protein